jgi:lipoprotein-anchoring transpeptidase ErfK/SrfK
MSRHRLEPARRVRPRLGRIAAAGLAVAVTLVALLGFVGLIPTDSAADSPDRTPVASSRAAGSAADAGDTTAPPGTSGQAATGASRSRADRPVSDALKKVAAPPDATASTALPADSGHGRRVVFSKSAQRVWIVKSDGSVSATYLVSGSVTDNLAPGKYDVYSRSRWAVGVDDSGVMQYFVRFAHGPNAAIGFHSIPTKNGVPLQTEAQLGTPQSHGCIRQKLSDAIRMWDFAGVGTDVVVLA